MTYDELQKKYIQVCNENMRLRAENQDLRKQLGILDYPKKFNIIDPTINKHSSVDENISALKNAGITVNLKSEFHQKFTIIDNTTIWYGSVNFLSFGSHEESIMRFESTDIATELLESL